MCKENTLLWFTFLKVHNKHVSLVLYPKYAFLPKNWRPQAYKVSCSTIIWENYKITTKIRKQLCSRCFSENENNYLLQYAVKSTIERETIFGVNEIILSRMKFLYSGSYLLVQCIIEIIQKESVTILISYFRLDAGQGCPEWVLL